MTAKNGQHEQGTDSGLGRRHLGGAGHCGIACGRHCPIHAPAKETTTFHLFPNFLPVIDFSFPLNSLEMIRKWCVMPKLLAKALLISHTCLLTRKSRFPQKYPPMLISN